MIKIKVTKALRGLLVVLLVPILTTNYSILSYGLTVDDLRAYIGETVEDANNTVIIDNNIVNGTDVYDTTTSETTYEYEQLKLELKDYEDVIKQRMVGSDNTLLIIALVENAKKIQDRLIELEALGNHKLVVIDNSYKDTADVTSDIQTILDSSNGIAEFIELDTTSIISPFYDIGFFGEYFFKPVDNSLRIITPYGYKKNSDGTYENKHLGIDIAAYKDSNIKPMFNGIISNIEKDLYGEYSVITIFHGNGLYTVYHHVKVNEDITRGKKVKYTDTIAVAVDTVIYESNKENHILMQVVLDSKYINPIYLFGDSGKELYNEWYRKTTETYVVDGNEFIYYDSKMSISNPNKDLEPEIVYENQATVEDNSYTKPNPGILNDIQKELGESGS